MSSTTNNHCHPDAQPLERRLIFAQRYCARGFRLLPTIDKYPPAGFKWGKHATTELAVIADWCRRWPRMDLAVALPSTVVVVDLDVRDGRDGFGVFTGLADVHADEVATIQAVTSSGGRHLWFDADGHAFRNDKLKKRDGTPAGFELKTVGGYVVVPPAPGRYWLPGSSMLKAPDWLKELFPVRAPIPIAPAKAARAHTPYGRMTLDRLCLRIALARKGEQDDTRTQLAFIIGSYLGGGELEAEDAWTQVVAAARAAETGTDANALRKETCLRRAFERGMSRPRSQESDWGESAIKALDAAHEREMGR
jgi:hypothetical protein